LKASSKSGIIQDTESPVEVSVQGPLGPNCNRIFHVERFYIIVLY